MKMKLLYFTKMQIKALSQVAQLQLLCIILFPMFFSQINKDNEFVNTLTYSVGLLMISYLILRNFAFNDEKYKTRLFFHTLPITPKTIIKARGIVVYVSCIIASPILVVFSYITNAIRPDLFAIMQVDIIPIGFLFALIFIPIEFLIFQFFQAQKADIIGALYAFPCMFLLIALQTKITVLMNSIFGLSIVLIAAVALNIVIYKLSLRVYINKAI